MAQKVVGYIKLQIPAGKATPAPPVGPAPVSYTHLDVYKRQRRGRLGRFPGALMALCYIAYTVYLIAR